jgi:hypothetical protein
MSAADDDFDHEYHWDGVIKNMQEAHEEAQREGDAISEFLDTPPMVFERERVPVPVDMGDEQNAKDDMDEVRHNLKQLIADGSGAIEGLLKVAQESESPRAYEVLATYLKQLTEMNKDLVGLHETKSKMETEKAKRAGLGGRSGDDPGQPRTTNNIFVGSTEELQAYLEKQR